MKRLLVRGFSSDKKLLEVTRTEASERFKNGGDLYGYLRNYSINKYSLTNSGAQYMHMLGMDQNEYDKMLSVMLFPSGEAE